MSKPRLTPLAERLPATVPFVGPEAAERSIGKPFTARLGANESVFGPSPKALDAMSAAGADAWKYPDPESHDLRHALAAHHDVSADEVVIGEGIDGLLGYVVRLFAGPGDAVVTAVLKPSDRSCGNRPFCKLISSACRSMAAFVGLVTLIETDAFRSACIGFGMVDRA